MHILPPPRQSAGPCAVKTPCRSRCVRSSPPPLRDAPYGLPDRLRQRDPPNHPRPGALRAKPFPRKERRESSRFSLISQTQAGTSDSPRAQPPAGGLLRLCARSKTRRACPRPWSARREQPRWCPKSLLLSLVSERVFSPLLLLPLAPKGSPHRASSHLNRPASAAENIARLRPDLSVPI